MEDLKANFFALDIGSSRITAIAAYDGGVDDFQILKKVTNACTGISGGFVTDPEAARRSIINSIYNLEKELQENITNVSIIISGGGASSNYKQKKLDKIAKFITKGDIKSLIRTSMDELQAQGKTPVHYFPLRYIVDDHNQVASPEGMIASKLNCKIHVITIDTNLIDNLVNCFSHYRIKIDYISISDFIGARASLSPDQRSLGCILIDIGDAISTISIWLEDKLFFTDYIKIAGNDITKDIAKKFSIKYSVAEKLKILYGSAIDSGYKKDNVIDIADLENDSAHRTITFNDLTIVIKNRLVSIISALKKKYDATGLDSMISNSIIITGGTASLRGTRELAGRIFEKQVEIKENIISDDIKADANLSSRFKILALETAKHRKNSRSYVFYKEALGKAIAWLKENI